MGRWPGLRRGEAGLLLILFIVFIVFILLIVLIVFIVFTRASKRSWNNFLNRLCKELIRQPIFDYEDLDSARSG